VTIGLFPSACGRSRPTRARTPVTAKHCLWAVVEAISIEEDFLGLGFSITDED
jgi:hypothetical protein